MGESTGNIASLKCRIEQLEHEREELQRDIEQLCMQQSGSGYIGIITRIQAQRIAGLEQEIETSKQKLAASMRNNHNLQEELSEVYRIKSQLADLHKSELEKNYEAEQQIKFFQSRVAAAFSERDRAIMEVDRAHQEEDSMSDKLNEIQNRMEEITADSLEQKRLCCELQSNLDDTKAENTKLKQVIEKFYQIRQAALGVPEVESDEDKAECLLQDTAIFWSFREAEDISKDGHSQMVSVQDELEASRDMIEKLHKHLEEAHTSEDLLLQRVSTLDVKLKQSEDTIKNELSLLRIFQVQKRNEILNLVEEERKWLEAATAELETQVMEQVMSKMVPFGSFDLNGDSPSTIPEQSENIVVNENAECSRGDTVEKHSDSLNISSEEQSNADDSRKVLAQALQEKVQALLLLSQQEERHFLEKNTKAALEEKVKELQQKLLQVTNEKVAALMEVAQLRQVCQQLQEHGRELIPGSKQQHNLNTNSTGTANEKDWRVKHLLKRSYLKYWLRGIDITGLKANAHTLGDDSSSEASKPKDAMDFVRSEASKPKDAMDFARLKVENASLQESMANMEHLTTSIHRLRLALLKVKEDTTFSAASEGALEVINGIINEARHIKTALGSSLPVSWSADSTSDLPDSSDSEIAADNEDHTITGLDSVSAAGIELVELLILAADLQKIELMQMSKQALLLENGPRKCSPVFVSYSTLTSSEAVILLTSKFTKRQLGISLIVS